MLLEDVFDMATGSVVKRSCFGFADKFGFTPSSVLVCVCVCFQLQCSAHCVADFSRVL